MTEQARGYVAPGFEPVRAAFEANASEELGASFAAIRAGETIVDLRLGFSERARTKAWSEATLCAVHSTGKPIAALVVARLIDTHGLDFATPVADIWPEFSAYGKDRLSVAQALAHQAGIPGFPDPIDPALWLDHNALAASLAALAPLWPPGTASGYHPMIWGYIAGEIVRRVTGRTLGTILRDDICAPRDIEYWVGLPQELDARVAEQTLPSRVPDFGPLTPIKRAAFLTKWAAPDQRDPRWRRVEIPSANGHGTALAIAQLYAFYAEEGGDILSREAFRTLTERRFLGEDLVLPFTLDWRAGPLGNNNRFYGPDSDALGHSGRGGSCGFADPRLRLSGGYVMNRQSPNLMGDPRAQHLIDALYSCA